MKYLCILFCFLTIRVSAQYSYSDEIVATVTIQSSLSLSITNNSGTSFTINNSTASTGYSVSNFNTVAVKSNTNWSLYVSAATPYFSASGSNSSSNMPASVITIGKTGQSTGISLSTTPQLLASGNRGLPSISGNTFNLSFLANPGYNYGPGIYNLTISYTLTPQ